MALKYELETVQELPSRTHKGFKKSSKYDPILDDYIARKVDNVKVTIPDKTGTYVVTQLNKRIAKREITSFEATSVNGVVFLIPVTPED